MSPSTVRSYAWLQWMVVIVLMIILAATCFGADWVFELPRILSLGWIPFLDRTMAEFAWDWPALASLCGCLLLGAATLHLVARMIAVSQQKTWSSGWSVRLCIMVLTLLGGSIALAGVVYQLDTIAKSPRWLGKSRFVTKEIHDARELVMAVRLHASDNGGRYPAQLEGLLASGSLEGFEDFEKLVTYVGDGSSPPAPWIYVRGLTDSAPGEIPLIIAPHTYEKGMRIIATNDTSVELMKPAAIRKLLPQWKERFAALGIPLPAVLAAYEQEALPAAK